MLSIQAMARPRSMAELDRSWLESGVDAAWPDRRELIRQLRPTINAMKAEGYRIHAYRHVWSDADCDYWGWPHGQRFIAFRLELEEER
jgi:hypothetical protein